MSRPDRADLIDRPFWQRDEFKRKLAGLRRLSWPVVLFSIAVAGLVWTLATWPGGDPWSFGGLAGGAIVLLTVYGVFEAGTDMVEWLHKRRGWRITVRPLLDDVDDIAGPECSAEAWAIDAGSVQPNRALYWEEINEALRGMTVGRRGDPKVGICQEKAEFRLRHLVDDLREAWCAWRNLRAVAYAETGHPRGAAWDEEKIRLKKDPFELNGVGCEEGSKIWSCEHSLPVQKTHYRGWVMSNQLANKCYHRIDTDHQYGGFDYDELDICPPAGTVVGTDGVAAKRNQEVAWARKVNGSWRLKGLCHAAVANPIGVSTVAVTSNGKMILVHQTARNNVSEGSLAPSGSGSMDWSTLEGLEEKKIGTLGYLVVTEAERELAEECGLNIDEISELQSAPIGYVRIPEWGGHPEFLVVTYVGEDSDDLDLGVSWEEGDFSDPRFVDLGDELCLWKYVCEGRKRGEISIQDKGRQESLPISFPLYLCLQALADSLDDRTDICEGSTSRQVLDKVADALNHRAKGCSSSTG